MAPAPPQPPGPQMGRIVRAPPLAPVVCDLHRRVHYFVLDGRFERTITTSGEAGSMISDAQFDALEGWLEAAAPDRPCFLVSPSASGR